MAKYEFVLQSTADEINLQINAFIDRAKRRGDIEPRKALNDLIIEVSKEFREQKKRIAMWEGKP